MSKARPHQRVISVADMTDDDKAELAGLLEAEMTALTDTPDLSPEAVEALADGVEYPQHSRWTASVIASPATLRALSAALTAAEARADAERERADRMGDALRWYADNDNWKNQIIERNSWGKMGTTPSSAEYDEGDRARAALAPQAGSDD